MNTTPDLSNPLDVLIPRSTAKNYILGGSAIVRIYKRDIARIYYEGNIYQASGLEVILGRLQVAAGRALTSAPTTAFMMLTDSQVEKEFMTVGVYQYDTNTLTIDPECMTEWNEWEKSYLTDNA